MFENVNVGDRVRLTGNGEVHEFTVERRGPDYFSTRYSTFMDSEGWTVDILTPEEPTTNGTIVTLFDTSVGRERTIVRTDGMWVDINVLYVRYAWDTWMNDAKPGSVKVVYTHE